MYLCVCVYVCVCLIIYIHMLNKFTHAYKTASPKSVSLLVHSLNNLLLFWGQLLFLLLFLIEYNLCTKENKNLCFIDCSSVLLILYCMNIQKFTNPFFYYTFVLFPVRKWLVYVNFVRNHKNNSPGCYTNLHSYQKCVRLPVSPHTCQHLLLHAFLILAILIVIKEHCLIVPAICISLMTN